MPHRTPRTPQGPLATAGTYTVRLTADGKSETHALTVKMDPRVKTPAVELEKLHGEQVKMVELMDELAKDDLAAHSVEEQLESPDNASLKEQLAPFAAKVKALLEGGESDKKAGPDKGEPGLDDLSGEARQLYTELDQADEPPTATLLASAATATEEAREAIPRWKGFVAKDLPALNRLLKGAGKPEIDLDKAPGNMPESGDEE